MIAATVIGTNLVIDYGSEEAARKALDSWPETAVGPLPDGACGVMGLCERRKGHEGTHSTSVDRALAVEAPVVAGIEVERLREAIANVMDAQPEPVPLQPVDARAIAAEYGALRPSVEPAGLSEAWAAAVAAFPTLGGWRMDAVVTHRPGEWKASAVPTPQSRRTASGSMWLGVTGTGPTPTAALLDLAALLPTQASDSPEKP